MLILIYLNHCPIICVKTSNVIVNLRQTSFTDCILGKCQNKGEILSISDDFKDQRLDEDKKVVSFYVFETVKTKYFNKLGKEVSYDRTARVDKKDLIQNIISQLQSVAMHCLIHCFLL